ncbi:MAG: LytTR family DNA-binding domain-containing protein [Arcicella sp.]|nr:LytTR family DNA-binding domain-containing protein [Arcicella sp.]
MTVQQHITDHFGSTLVLGGKTKLFSNEILFFEGDINYTRIHFTSGKRQVVARTLLYIQQKTNTENFIRINRKYLVNRKFIVKVMADYVVLIDKTVLPISRRRRGAFCARVVL